MSSVDFQRVPSSSNFRLWLAARISQNNEWRDGGKPTSYFEEVETSGNDFHPLPIFDEDGVMAEQVMAQRRYYTFLVSIVSQFKEMGWFLAHNNGLFVVRNRPSHFQMKHFITGYQKSFLVVFLKSGPHSTTTSVGGSGTSPLIMTRIVTGLSDFFSNIVKLLRD
jgi:hypothetical protein